MANCDSCKKKVMTTKCPHCKKLICVFCKEKHLKEHGLGIAKVVPTATGNVEKKLLK